ncbi:MAG: hypothetical protein U9N61_04365 [Euryarchaeota archaeon]|nr:hypothetical protein [Euryarchaeota archaeon]
MKIYHVYANPTDPYGDWPVSFGYYSSEALAEERIAELKSKRLVVMAANGHAPSALIQYEDRYDEPVLEECEIDKDENDECAYDHWL